MAKLTQDVAELHRMLGEKEAELQRVTTVANKRLEDYNNLLDSFKSQKEVIEDCNQAFIRFENTITELKAQRDAIDRIKRDLAIAVEENELLARNLNTFQDKCYKLQEELAAQKRLVTTPSVFYNDLCNQIEEKDKQIAQQVKDIKNLHNQIDELKTALCIKLSVEQKLNHGIQDYNFDKITECINTLNGYPEHIKIQSINCSRDFADYLVKRNPTKVHVNDNQLRYQNITFHFPSEELRKWSWPNWYR